MIKLTIAVRDKKTDNVKEAIAWIDPDTITMVYEGDHNDLWNCVSTNIMVNGTGLTVKESVSAVLKMRSIASHKEQVMNYMTEQQNNELQSNS